MKKTKKQAENDKKRNRDKKNEPVPDFFTLIECALKYNPKKKK